VVRQVVRPSAAALGLGLRGEREAVAQAPGPPVHDRPLVAQAQHALVAIELNPERRLCVVSCRAARVSASVSVSRTGLAA
jgi:hypothetical protein